MSGISSAVVVGLFWMAAVPVVQASEIAVDAQRPVRVIVTASDGSHPDGSGRGVYSDGRFFADGTFKVQVPPGKTTIHLSAGPDFVPLELTAEPKDGEQLHLTAALKPWFSPRDRGWLCGDNHVHAQHDEKADVRTDYDYAVLQARANGLSFITENGSAHAGPADVKRLSTPDFLMMQAGEQRPGPFLGHFNTPGIRQPLRAITARPLYAQALLDAVHQLGGAVAHTHTLAPTHQLHWMGATEMFSDAVLGRCADAFDTDSPVTECFRFAVLNLGNHIAVSSYTDCDLGRRRTFSPGDRRVYCHVKELSAASVVEALRGGHTFATDGGPVFAFFTVDDHEPGDTIHGHDGTARAEVHSQRPLRAVELYRRGNRVKSFDVKSETMAWPIHETERSWYTLRAEDIDGHWAVTSPVYFDPPEAGPRPAASVVLLEISNASRYAGLRREFYAHLIATVSPGLEFTTVQLLKDGAPIHRFSPADGNHLPADGKIPVTGLGGDYAPGSVWQQALHLQADERITDSGWYSVRATTAGGRSLETDAVYFDASNPNSQELSVVNLAGGDTQFTLWGYGEDLPLAQAATDGHWWYPDKKFSRICATFVGTPHEFTSGNRAAQKLFRQAP